MQLEVKTILNRIQHFVGFVSLGSQSEGKAVGILHRS